MGTAKTELPGQPGPVRTTTTVRAFTVPRTTTTTTRPLDGSTDQDLVSSSDILSTVRSNFPETWIWTEAATGCVMLLMCSLQIH